MRKFLAPLLGALLLLTGVGAIAASPAGAASHPVLSGALARPLAGPVGGFWSTTKKQGTISVQPHYTRSGTNGYIYTWDRVAWSTSGGTVTSVQAWGKSCSGSVNNGYLNYPASQSGNVATGFSSLNTNTYGQAEIDVTIGLSGGGGSFNSYWCGS